MKRCFLVFSAALGLSACNTYPDTADLDTEVAGNYQHLADCAYVEITGGAFPPGTTKIELPSKSLSRIQFGQDQIVIGQLDFTDLGGDRTRVTLRHQRAIYGTDFYANRYLQIVNRCATELG